VGLPDERSFARETSHALRDPLTICRGHLELLVGLPKEQQLTVALVIDELDRMARIIEDVETLAEAERADFIRTEQIDLTLFAHELVAHSAAMASRRWELDQCADGMLQGDRYHLAHAVMNLAHNAVERTREDDTVAIGVARSDEEARIWVRDTGVGIAELSSDAGDCHRASGLGLAVVKAIAEAHGGRLEEEDGAEAGSTFTIVIPTRTPPAGGVESRPHP
jgi:two-component system, OmpR family, sensor kinase